MASVSPPPYGSDLSDSNKKITAAWAIWVRDVFQRIGGLEAPTNLELGTGATLTTVQSNVSAQSALISQLRADVDGLLQGRAL